MNGWRRTVGVVISRRVLFRRAGEAAALAGVASALAGCDTEPDVPSGDAGPVPEALSYPGVPTAPAHVPEPSTLRFFTGSEAATAEALFATILPGDADDPGAREAGVMTYVDYKLATTPGGTATRSYTKGPFAHTYSGSAPPTSDSLWVAEDEIDRYGPQSQQTPREVYRAGLRSLERYVEETYGASFTALATADQEAVVGALEDGSASGFDEPSAKDFFKQLRQDVAEGMFSDPVYGGNRDFAGWRLIGYPGAQRAWTPDDVKGRTPPREPQGLQQLHAFHAGYADGPNVVLPVSGSRGGHETAEDQGR